MKRRNGAASIRRCWVTVHENSRADEQPALLLVMPFNDSEQPNCGPSAKNPCAGACTALPSAARISEHQRTQAGAFGSGVSAARAAITADQRLVVRLVGEQVPKNLADNAKGLADYIAEQGRSRS
ncbi:MAG: hypothetical protein U1F68_06470 [Gammaproteobacteria bacterium]